MKCMACGAEEGTAGCPNGHGCTHVAKVTETARPPYEVATRTRREYCVVCGSEFPHTPGQLAACTEVLETLRGSLGQLHELRQALRTMAKACCKVTPDLPENGKPMYSVKPDWSVPPPKDAPRPMGPTSEYIDEAVLGWHKLYVRALKDMDAQSALQREASAQRAVGSGTPS